MEAVVLVIHLIVAVAIIAIILIQPAESGGFLGSSGSMSNMMAPRRGGDVLSRATTILAGCFFTTSLILAVMAGHHPAQQSILDAAVTDTPAPAAVEQKLDAAGAPKTEGEMKGPAPIDAAKPAAPKAPVSK